MGHLVEASSKRAYNCHGNQENAVLQGNTASYCPPIDQSDCNMISSHITMYGIILFLRKVLPRKFQVALERYCIILTTCMVCGAEFGGSGIQYRFETENTQLLP